MPFTLAASYFSSPLHVVVFIAISIGVGVAAWAPFTIARRFRTFKCAAVFIGTVTAVLGLILTVAPVRPLLASAEAAATTPSAARPARAATGTGRSPGAESAAPLVANMPVQIEPLPAVAPAPAKPAATKSAAPVKAAAPVKPAAAAKSVASATASAPAKSGAVVKSGAPVKPAAQTATAGAVKSAGQATPAGPVKTAAAVKPTAPAKPGAPAKAGAPVKTAAAVKPAPQTRASAPEKPATVAKAPVATQPAVASKPPAPAAPVAVVSDADLASPFTDEINAFSIQFPRAWKSGPIAGNPWVLEATDAGRAYISVGVQEMPGKPLPIATTLSNIAAHLRTQPDTVLHDSGTDTIQGHAYAWFRYTAPMPTTTGAARMTMVHYVIPMPSRALEVRMAATPDKFAALQPLMNRSMESFEILETRTADASGSR